ncbi:MAG TPA: LLM class flavin-dependent oxidoreductase [Steroidobacteraceae bacterium]|jgi:alkanesulfonate monooxygenase SsuD/methylene tetrahydromethanopterin reductase-like flavin-dependent oxidoreductase (luciferase family)
MQTWYFSEQSYHPAWDQIRGDIRITTASDVVDPEVAHKLLKRYMDEWVVADELGFDIMVNEHHATHTCMSVSCMLTLSVLANRTKRARLLALGVPLLNRFDPFRIAEEIAYVDMMSGGRLEVGLVKGTPFELYVSNANPSHSMGRYWEAHDLIEKALTHQSGPFSWEGENFHYRYVNVIPRCYQQPRPPMWLTTLSASTAAEAARRNMVLAITASAPTARGAYPLYRDEYLKVFKKPAGLDKLAFLGYVGIAKDRETGLARGQKVLKFVEATERTSPSFIMPPGIMPPSGAAKMLRAGEVRSHRTRVLPDGTPMSSTPLVGEYIKNSVMFSGAPDDVFNQLKEFYDSVGGFGHFLMQMGGTLTSEETVDSLELFARDVAPRLRELTNGKFATH